MWYCPMSLLCMRVGREFSIRSINELMMAAMNYRRFMVDINWKCLGMGNIRDCLQLDYLRIPKGRASPMYDFLGLRYIVRLIFIPLYVFMTSL